MDIPLRFALLGALVFVLLTPTCAARAETPSSEAVVESRREHAKAEFKRGSDLYNAGQYRPAVAAFMAADKLSPSAALSFNIALAYEKLDDPSGALRWYRDYLRRNPRAPNASAVNARVNELSNKLGRSGVQQLTVLSAPDGATVLIDGRAIGQTPFTGELALGQHRVELQLAGYRDATSELTLSPSAARDLNIKLDAAPVPAPASTAGGVKPAPSVHERDGERRFGVVPWLFVGGGLAGLGGALGFELARRSDEEQARNASQLDFKREIDAMQRHQTTARVLAGVGGALFVTGGVLLLFNTRAPAPPRVAFGCTPRGCNATAQGSF
ncbi:MAG TPA: PEGA domain-containing protein [Polyangiaceae bacterium]|nr:PEGA domain-containing protein [Polyangiaceae bacterium]